MRLKFAKLGHPVDLTTGSDTLKVFIKQPPSETLRWCIVEAALCSYEEFEERYHSVSSSVITTPIQNSLIELGLVSVDSFKK